MEIYLIAIHISSFRCFWWHRLKLLTLLIYFIISMKRRMSRLKFVYFDSWFVFFSSFIYFNFRFILNINEWYCLWFPIDSIRAPRTNMKILTNKQDEQNVMYRKKKLGYWTKETTTSLIQCMHIYMMYGCVCACIDTLFLYYSISL